MQRNTGLYRFAEVEHKPRHVIVIMFHLEVITNYVRSEFFQLTKLHSNTKENERKLFYLPHKFVLFR